MREFPVRVITHSENVLRTIALRRDMHRLTASYKRHGPSHRVVIGMGHSFRLVVILSRVRLHGPFLTLIGQLILILWLRTTA